MIPLLVPLQITKIQTFTTKPCLLIKTSIQIWHYES
jgi:hypothetical protein